MTIIETERLILRPFVDTDAARLLDIHSRLDIIKWLSDPPHVPMADLDEARAWITDRREREAADPFDLARAIEVRGSGEVAGTALIARLVRREGGFVGEHEVGWHLHPDSAGHGYATEAARGLLEDAFARGLGEVWCGMFEDNGPSRRVAERLGLPYFGVRPDPWYEGENPMFHITREQWQAR